MDEPRRVVWAWVNDWAALFSRGRRWNWQSLHVIEVYVERDNVCRTLDLHVAVLGLGFTVWWYAPRWMFPRNDTRDRACSLADEVAKEDGR